MMHDLPTPTSPSETILIRTMRVRGGRPCGRGRGPPPRASPAAPPLVPQPPLLSQPPLLPPLPPSRSMAAADEGWAAVRVRPRVACPRARTTAVPLTAPARAPLHAGCDVDGP
jgi:hypothetical protein